MLAVGVARDREQLASRLRARLTGERKSVEFGGIDYGDFHRLHLAGHFFSYRGKVVDWTTGAVMREVSTGDIKLLPNGTSFYRLYDGGDDSVYRWDAGASEPLELPRVEGSIVAVAR